MDANRLNRGPHFLLSQTLTLKTSKAFSTRIRADIREGYKSNQKRGKKQSASSLNHAAGRNSPRISISARGLANDSQTDSRLARPQSISANENYNM